MNKKFIIYHLFPPQRDPASGGTFIIRKSAGFTPHPTPRSSERGSTQCSRSENTQCPDRKVVGAGFTFIELMVVISITAVLGALSIAGFVNYNQTQVLQASGNEVATMLNLAKSRAQSQIKPSALCTQEDNLDGYSVVFSEGRKYTLYLNCSVGSTMQEKKINEEDKSLPSGLSFDSNPTFFFPVQTGGVQSPGQLVISNSNGKTKTIIVNSLGGVSVQ